MVVSTLLSLHRSFQMNRLHTNNYEFGGSNRPPVCRIPPVYIPFVLDGDFKRTTNTTPPIANGTMKSIGEGGGGGGINIGASIGASIIPTAAAIYLRSNTRTTAPPPMSNRGIKLL
jgi:hypothetical protein